MTTSAKRARSVWLPPLAGLLSGVVGALCFAALHAVLIVPIWDRMTSGLAFGALAGAAAGWALAELEPGHADLHPRAAAALGLRFGALLWLLVAPVSLADATLRLFGLAPRFELLAVGVALVLAPGAGWIFGRVRTGRRRGGLAGAAATLALTVAMAGPVPIGKSLRALGIFFAVLPAAALGGVALALVSRAFHRHWPRHGTKVAADSLAQPHR
ncbi:MAG TPA: hypothetical protein VK922_18385 [Gemmatimonadaceae bacterium]|nr:hypothetical protein [Gemmatimonadaceae bacterium]